MVLSSSYRPTGSGFVSVHAFLWSSFGGLASRIFVSVSPLGALFFFIVLFHLLYFSGVPFWFLVAISFLLMGVCFLHLFLSFHIYQ